MREEASYQSWFQKKAVLQDHHYNRYLNHHMSIKSREHNADWTLPDLTVLLLPSLRYCVTVLGNATRLLGPGPTDSQSLGPVADKDVEAFA